MPSNSPNGAAKTPTLSTLEMEKIQYTQVFQITLTQFGVSMHKRPIFLVRSGIVFTRRANDERTLRSTSVAGGQHPSHTDIARYALIA